MGKDPNISVMTFPPFVETAKFKKGLSKSYEHSAHADYIKKIYGVSSLLVAFLTGAFSGA